MRSIALLFTALLFQTSHAQQWNWAADAGGGGNTDFCYGIATDSQGNAYWVGTVSGTAEFGCATIAAGNTIVGVLAKYSSAGSCQWVRGITTGFYDAWVYDIVIDHEDRIYITGSCQGDADFGNGIVLDGSGSSDDWFTARYDVDGTCLWAERIAGGNGSSEGRAIEVDANGGIYVTGFAGGSGYSFGDVVVENGGFTRQTVIVKYDSMGTALWGKSTNGTTGGRCNARGISVAGDRLYVTGQVYFATTAYQGVPITTASTAACTFVLACDLNGDPVWARSFLGSDHEGFGIAADTLGNLFVTGRLHGNMYLPDDTLTSASDDDDILLMGLSTSGDLRWAELIGAQNQDDGWDVVCDGQGNAYFAAHFENTVDVFGTPFAALGSEDALIMKLEADGDLVWAARPSGFQRDIPLTIHRQTEAPHQLYFGGYFWGAITYGSTTIDDVLNGDAMIVAGIDTTFDASATATGVCPGGNCDGVAYAFANGVEPFTYSWSTGATTSLVEGLCYGEYVVEVTDAEGNVEVDTVFVSEFDEPALLTQLDVDSLWIEGGSEWVWYADDIEVSSGQPYHIAEFNGQYRVGYLDVNGCPNGTTPVTVVLNVGIEERSNEVLRAHPNPTAERVTIHWEGAAPVQATLFNSAGQRIRTTQLLPGMNVLEMNGLEPGLYLLRTADGGVVRVGKE